MRSEITPPVLAPAFYLNLDRFGDTPALIVAQTGETVSFAELERLTVLRQAELGSTRKLIFAEARNDPGSIVDYLACLRGSHVLCLVEDLKAAKVEALIALYRPNLLIDARRALIPFDNDPADLHPECALLVSTSGSTGSAKFVKLSKDNLNSNAAAIVDYLLLNASERAFQHLKMFYSYGLSIINSHLLVGAALILSDKIVTEAEFWRLFDTYEATSFAGVPYTFESLKRIGFKACNHPSLRYATQAGGRLDDSLVAEFANDFLKSGRRLIVMYGQTEASPRMSYLHADYAPLHPGSVGKAIAGSRLFLLDEDGKEIEEPGQTGELAFEGPGVMLGYANSRQDLATQNRPKRLLTGDIAKKDENGFFYIVGRTSRFVKPFGLRVNLEDIERFIRDQTQAPCAVAGNDQLIVIASETKASNIDLSSLSERFGLPVHAFKTMAYDALPALTNGKVDLPLILSNASLAQKSPRETLAQRLTNLIKDLLGLQPTSWHCVSDIYQAYGSGRSIDLSTRINDMGADSLAFVSIAVEIEELFGGSPPEGWHLMTLGDLEAAFEALQAQAAHA